MVPCARAGNVNQVTLGVVDLLQIGIVADRLNTLLQGNDLVVAGHHGHGPELKTLGEMHGADEVWPLWCQRSYNGLPSLPPPCALQSYSALPSSSPPCSLAQHQLQISKT